MMSLESGGSAYLGMDGQLTCSLDTATLVDQEVQRLIGEAFDRATQILKANAAKLSQLTNYLLEKETLLGDEFMEILNASAPEALEKQSAPPAESGDPA